LAEPYKENRLQNNSHLRDKCGTLENKLCETLVKPWQNLGGTFPGTFWQPKTEENRTPQNLENLGVKPWRTLVEPWWNPGGTLVEPSRNLGRTFRATFGQPNTDLPQRTIDGPKAILPRNLYYG